MALFGYHYRVGSLSKQRAKISTAVFNWPTESPAYPMSNPGLAGSAR